MRRCVSGFVKPKLTLASSPTGHRNTLTMEEVQRWQWWTGTARPVRWRRVYGGSGVRSGRRVLRWDSLTRLGWCAPVLVHDRDGCYDSESVVSGWRWGCRGGNVMVSSRWRHV